MEENKAKENKIENLPLKETEKSFDLENLPRDPAGKLLIEAIATGKNEKGFYIVPDEIMDKYYNELPAGTVNQSRTWRAADHGKLKILGGDPEKDIEIQRAGANTLNATKAQRRTFAEVIEEMLVKPANAQMIEDLELTTGATNLDAIIAAALKQSARGNVKAMDFIRDTIGQKPTEKLDASITGLSPEDKQLLQNVSNRIGQQPQDVD